MDYTIMPTHHAPYTNEDSEYHAICAFLDALAAEDPFMHWESGRMNFWRYNVHAGKDAHDPFFRHNVHLWRAEDEQIVALCISEYGGNDLFIEVRPAYLHLYPEIFDWVEQTWAASRPSIEIDVFGADVQKIQRLEARGFTFQSHFENKRVYDLAQADLDYTLPDGFTIQTLSALADVAGRVALVRSAFDNTHFNQNNVQRLMASPDYIAEYDLSVVSTDGRQVAYCIGWRDHRNAHSGFVEPVGTHADFRRRGFAKAINQECFRRMKADGIKLVEIASRAEPNVSNFLYDSLGPREKREVHKYVKQV
ncbi:MAG: GNAT family N-acetyltransferase [Caldilineaceae bacterium]